MQLMLASKMAGMPREMAMTAVERMSEFDKHLLLAVVTIAISDRSTEWAEKNAQGLMQTASKALERVLEKTVKNTLL